MSLAKKKVAIEGESDVQNLRKTSCLTDVDSPEEHRRPTRIGSFRTMRTDRSSASASETSFEGRTKTPAVMKTSKSVLYGRLLFVLVLVAAAVSLGFVSYRLMSDSETQLASERFDSIAERALSTAQLVIEEKKKATDSLALMMASTNPDADIWPNVYMEGYEQVSSSLRIVTEGSLSFCPIVLPGGEEQASFEAFAYDLFRNIQNFPEDIGVSDFGEGIFSYGEGEFGNETWPDGRFHITSGWTYHYSQQNILVPFLQSDSGPHDVLMLNIHFEHHRAAAIDNVIICSEERVSTMDFHRECGSMTDLMWSETAADVEPGPAGLMMVPIYPRNNNMTVSEISMVMPIVRFFISHHLHKQLTGFIVGKQIWHDLLKHGFESDVNGVDVVLRTENFAHTYRVVNGNVTYLGEGTTYLNPNPRFSSVGRHINPNYFSNITVKYYMDIYSNKEFYQAYSTNNARTACIGAVLIIVGTSLLFFFYDYFVRKEFHDKRKLLEAKRQFVRFVSHEVRTPLNTVCMGLTLMQHDFASALGLRRSSGGARTTTTTAVPCGDDKVDLEKLQEWMQLSTQVYQNAETAVNVLSDLLNYDKIQMGTLTLELSLVPIIHSVEKTMNEFKIAAMESKVHLQLDLLPLLRQHNHDQDIEAGVIEINQLPLDIQAAKVVADNVRLAQVFRNLLSNALKFSNENGTC